MPEIEIQKVRNDLFELSHEIFKIYADIYDCDYEQTDLKLMRCLKKLGDILIMYHRWDNNPNFYKQKLINTKERK